MRNDPTNERQPDDNLDETDSGKDGTVLCDMFCQCDQDVHGAEDTPSLCDLMGCAEDCDGDAGEDQGGAA